ATSIEVRSGFSHSSVPEIFVEGGGGVGVARRACVGVNSGVGCAARREAASAAATAVTAMARVEAFMSRGILPGARLRSRPSRRAEVRDLVSRIAFPLLKWTQR